MLLGKKLDVSILSLIIFVLVMFSIAQAKSVYVITDRASTIKAYDIQSDQIEEQAAAENLAVHGGAVGLALDPDSETLFVTYEGSNVIEMVNAKTMVSEENPVSVPGGSSLAGIAFDQYKQKLYVVKRQDNRLYVYLWNPVRKKLTLEGDIYKTLENIGTYPYGAWGIALDKSSNSLYVTSSTNTVYYYDTNDPNFGCKGFINIDVNSIARQAVGIAVDSTNRYMYTGSFTGGYGQHYYLVRTDINDVNNPLFKEKPIGAHVIGITTDPCTGLIYITTSNYHIEVHDTNNFDALPYDTETTDSSGPADIVLAGDVSYKDPFPLVELVKDVNDGNCVSPLISEAEHELYGTPYNWLYYNIHYDANGFADTNVFITDHLPDEVDYNSSDPNGYYDPDKHTVTWKIPVMSASDSNTYRIQVGVNHYAKPGYKIYNYCEIESDEYCTFAVEDTNICCYGGDIIYVNKDANDPNSCHNGTSWLHAYKDLQEALHTARTCDCDQIRAAEGTYKPTTTSDRSIFFELVNNIAIYGGFPNSGDPNFADRNWQTRITTLSGDIGTPNEKNDNSYHVVKCEDVNNVILDGFTITAGKANAQYPDPNYCGGGIYCKDSNNLTVSNCIISQNEASSGSSYGGGIYFKDSNNLTLTDCNVSNNSAYHGGGLHIEFSSANITNCIFNDNSTDMSGGGMYNDQSSPILLNCTFTANTSTGSSSCGGGMYNDQSSPTIINCTFSSNSASKVQHGMGGAMCNTNSSEPNVTNSIFSNNSAWYGGAVYNYYSDANITNCIFIGNDAIEYGGGIFSSSSKPKITKSIFTGNNVTDLYNGLGGAMYNIHDPSPVVVNSIFAGNDALYGGGISDYNSSPTLTNCTLIGNSASYGGGMYNYNNSSPNLTNCILWGNVGTSDGDEIYNYPSSESYPNISYSDIKASNGSGSNWVVELGTDVGYNIDEDPCFFDVQQSGSWSEDAFYDSSTFQSTLTDSSADWAVNELAGKFVNPYTLQALQFFIVSNDVNTINVWGNVESIAKAPRAYHIYDYHLTTDSPCIDRGDPNGDYTGQTDIDGEPRVFDGDYNDVPIVDMGADEYYWSPADFNSDGFVNFFDYALIADVWQLKPEDVNDYNDVYDLVDNDFIDSNDLARFCEDWLWQTPWAKAFPFSYGRGMGKSMGMGEGFFPSIESKQARPELTADDIEQILKWLADLWLTDEEVRKIISEDDWLKFIESVTQVAKQLINN